jgi:HEAT repeat protein/Mg-chelatase subunit ChlD
MLRKLLAVSLVALASFGTLTAALAPDELEDLIAEVKKNREETDLEVLDRLAAFKSRPACDGLIELYELQGSLYMRIEILKRLPNFDNVGDCQQVALQHLADVATGGEDLELRDAALTALGACTELGKSFLELIVASGAADSVRERALDLHIERKSESDNTWYKKIYESELGLAEVDKKAKKKNKGGDEVEAIVYKLPELAHKAFAAMVTGLDDTDLVEALEGDQAAIQSIALEEYGKRNAKKANKFAEQFYKHPETPVRLRILSARILAGDDLKKVSKRFIEDAEKFATPNGLRLALADMLAELNDGGINKKLIRGLDKGKSYEKIFALRAIVNSDEPKLNEKAQEMLLDEDLGVRYAAATFLVKRADMSAVAPLEQYMEKLEDPVAIAHAMDLLSELRGDSSEWDAKLVEYAKSGQVEVRNAALYRLGKDGRGQHFDLLVAGLGNADWSTRLAALRGLEQLREARAIGPLIARMQKEVGRMKVEFSQVLFNLTGQPFRNAEKSWEAWWNKESANFKVISMADLERAREAEELRRLKQVTNSKFFGIRIISHRVIFIIDVSGSMEEKMVTQFEGGSSLTRMAVAIRELIASIKSMDRGALFNIIIFSSEVDPWLEDGIAGANQAERDEAEAFVARLKPGGGTNLYDSIKMAFGDPDVDTIFILSDGEPTVGAVTDVNRIRADVAAWNEHRHIQINTIGIGGKLKILEWLAEDAGGEHVKLR